MAKLKQWCGLVLSASVAASMSTPAQAFDKLIIFGDSLSDTGNVYNYTKKAHDAIPFVKVPIIPAEPYYKGRFSNGYNWIDYLQKDLGISSKHYRTMAFGGAWIEPFKQSKHLFPLGLSSEVSYYLSTSFLDRHKKDHLYVLWDGGNDYLNGRSGDDANAITDNVINIVSSNIEKLIHAGAKNILIANLPDLGKTPYALTEGNPVANRLTELTTLHNNKLTQTIKQLQQAHPNANIVMFDAFGALNDAIERPQEFGITNVTNACLVGGPVRQDDPRLTALQEVNMEAANTPSIMAVLKATSSGYKECSNPDSYLFFDDIHPTQTGHRLIANMALLAVGQLHG